MTEKYYLCISLSCVSKKERLQSNFSIHTFHTHFSINNNPSSRHYYFLNKWSSSIKTCGKTVQHQRSNTTLPWNCFELKEGVPPSHRQIRPYIYQGGETQNTIDIDQIVGEIVSGPQYNLQGGYLFESLLTVKYLWHSHWNPVNITEYVIE